MVTGQNLEQFGGFDGEDALYVFTELPFDRHGYSITVSGKNIFLWNKNKIYTSGDTKMIPGADIMDSYISIFTEITRPF